MKQIGEMLPEIEGESLIEDAGFESFWVECPRKTDKKAAMRAWEKLNEQDRLAATAGMIYHRDNNPQWRDKSLIPHPSTFLNGRRFEDEIVIPRREEVTSDVSDLGKMVWSAMTQMFGQSWITKHGDRPSPIWRNQLTVLTQDDIKQGLKHLVETGEQHPPSLPYFISICKRKTLPEYQRLPRPEPDEKLARASIAEMKKILGVS
jgi:hypothetical protein